MKMLHPSCPSGYKLFSILAWLLVSCGGQSSHANVSLIEFLPNPAQIKEGKCESQAQVIEVNGKTVSLLSLEAVFLDERQNTARVVLNSSELSLVSDSQTIPGYSSIKLPLSFDLGSQGVSAPAQGSIVVLGSGSSGVTQFIGFLRCEGGT